MDCSASLKNIGELDVVNAPIIANDWQSLLLDKKVDHFAYNN